MESTAPGDDDERSRSNRRRFLKGLGALSVVGFAGCSGDDGEGSPTDTDTDIDTTATEADTPTPTETDTPTPTETDTPTPTETSVPGFGDEPEPLIELSTSPRTPPGGNTTVSGTIENEYDFEVRNGDFTLEAPSDEWSVSAVNGTTFDSLESDAEQSIEWEVTAPDTSDTFEFSVTGSYQNPDGSETANVSKTHSVTVQVPNEAPIGIDCGGARVDATVTIDGLEFLPDAETRQSIQEKEDFECDANARVTDRWWTDIFTIEPAPVSFGTEGECGTIDIANTEHDALYSSEHWSPLDLEYVFYIENGTYDVTLHHCEFSPDNAPRIFTVSVQGETVIELEETLSAVAGGTDTALSATAEEVEVTDNQLIIKGEASEQNPQMNGIEIRASESQSQ